jgi:hypothetical protein
MPQPGRSNKRDKGVEVIREFRPDLKAQARALLILIGVSPENAQTSANSQVSPENGGDDAQGGRP